MRSNKGVAFFLGILIILSLITFLNMLDTANYNSKIKDLMNSYESLLEEHVSYMTETNKTLTADNSSISSLIDSLHLQNKMIVILNQRLVSLENQQHTFYRPSGRRGFSYYIIEGNE